MDIRKVKKLIELLEESGIAEIEIREGEDSVRISRHGQAGTQVAMQHAVHAPTLNSTAPAAAVEAAAPAAPIGHTVNAPMVGTSISLRRPAPHRL